MLSKSCLKHIHEHLYEAKKRSYKNYRIDIFIYVHDSSYDATLTDSGLQPSTQRRQRIHSALVCSICET